MKNKLKNVLSLIIASIILSTWFICGAYAVPIIITRSTKDINSVLWGQARGAAPAMLGVIH